MPRGHFPDNMNLGCPNPSSNHTPHPDFPMVLPRFTKSYNVYNASPCPERHVIFFLTTTHTHTRRISASHFLVGYRYASTWGCYTIHMALWLPCANSAMTAEVRTGPQLQNATSPRSCMGIRGIRLRFPHMSGRTEFFVHSGGKKWRTLYNISQSSDPNNIPRSMLGQHFKMTCTMSTTNTTNHVQP